MLLKYTGGGEVIPQLGDRFISPGEVVNVRNKAVEKQLIKTARFEVEKPVKKASVPKKPKKEITSKGSDSQ